LKLTVEDVKEAININTLEIRINLLKWVKMNLQDNHSRADMVEVLEALIDKDRHHLQKYYKVTIE